ncbi:iron transporter [Halobacteriales archaeon QH_9_66_26]|nr:MAG: iron transporter [Halobacteriales archaeon QH_9_66_26]
MKRRSILQACAGGLAAVSGGCLDAVGLQTQSAWRDPPLVDDRPDGVYYPAVTEGMATYGTTTAGPYTVALTYSYPHRFWQVTGSEREKTVVGSEDSVHLMASIWDTQSGTVIPVDGLSAEVTTEDGELVAEEVIYPMLSQQMGYHSGANFALPGDGSYRAAVSIGGTAIRRTGRFTNRFDEPHTATFAFEFTSENLYDIEIRRLGEKAGTRGAVEPMEMGIPVGRAPPVERLPGTPIGRATSGDAVVPMRAIPDESGGTRIAAFPRTPYNRIVLPLMALSATIERNAQTVAETPLTRTLDPRLGYHHAAPIEDVRPDDTLRVSVETPPQVARHDGYETAFLEMGPMTLSVPETIA